MADHLQACQSVVKVIAAAIKQLEGENYVTLSCVPSWIAQIFLTRYFGDFFFFFFFLNHQTVPSLLLPLMFVTP